MVHKLKHKVHSFRGLLGDGGYDEINLERQNVNLAYRVVKLQIIRQAPTASIDHVVKVLREEPTTVPSSSATIDLSDMDLLAVAALSGTAFGEYDSTIIFDNVLFSRNIYVTHTDNDGGDDCNYYIEIEEVPVTAATLMQLKLQVARKLSLQQD